MVEQVTWLTIYLWIGHCGSLLETGSAWVEVELWTLSDMKCVN